MSRAARNTAKYEERMKSKGFVRKHVWVPADTADEIEALAEELRRAAQWDDSAVKQERDTIIKVLAANKLWLQTLGIEHIGLFGSFARGDAGPNSDIDLVVDIKKSDRPKGLFGMAKFRMILLNLLIAQGKLNRDVDVVEWQNIKPELHETMTAESIEIF